MENIKSQIGRNGEKMKKAVKLFIMVVAIISGLFLVSATEIEAKATSHPEGVEYTIFWNGEDYGLSSLGETNLYESLAICLAEIENPVSIRFVDVSSFESISLPRGEYEICGDLYSSGVISIPSGAIVTVRELSLTLGANAYIRIKGGSLTIESSSISGDDQLINLDYSAASRLEIISGVISGETENPLISIENGQAVIRGADIDNKGGAAIKNDGELCLLGSPKISGATYGIILESPMYMGADTDEYYSMTSLSVKYLDTFMQGTLTEVFYNVTERSLSNVLLYDRDGKVESITHFESSTHTDERNFAGVYLPHVVKFFIGDELVAEQKLLSGEKISSVSADDIEGYEFSGWYRNREGGDPYASEKRVYSSFSLYGIYSLDAPKFGISSLDFVYDGKDHTLSFDYLSHPLSGGYYTYEWQKDGAQISTMSCITVKNVSDSGSYSCRITYNLNGDSASVYAENIKINIDKQSVSSPIVPGSKYNGFPQYPMIASSELYSIGAICGIDAGTYPVTITLFDSSNFTWHDSDEESITLIFEIIKADNAWVSLPSAWDSYIGFPQQISAASLFGKVEFFYSATENGVYTSDAPTSVGNYFVKAAVAESANYSALNSDPIPFSILPEEVVGLLLNEAPNKIEYFAFDEFDPEGMEISAVYNSGRQEPLSSSRINFVYNNGENLRVGDVAIVAEYLGASLPISVTVNQLTYDLSGIDMVSKSITYDGGYHTLSPSKELSGLDGIPLSYEIIGGGTDAGEYEVKIRFFGESKDYVIPEDITLSLVILPLTVDLSWDIPEFIYDSTPKIPSASFIDVMGVRRTVLVCGSAILAGADYSAEAVRYSSNYAFSNPTCLFSIAKAEYDMSSAAWSDNSLVYTGESLEVVLTNLPAGVTVVGYTDNRAQNVGKYVATASLKYDERNYNTPKAPSCEWEIKPADYDMSSISVVPAEFEYDGKEHYPILSGSMPIGADGSSPTFSFSRGAINVSDGDVMVTVTFNTGSKNYNVPSSYMATVKIIPKGIYVTWTSDSFTYDGNVKSPAAESPIAPIKVSEGKINAGSYIAIAESADSNYEVVNATYGYEIKKAENYWIYAPSITDFYDSRSPAPYAAPYYGKAEFIYYSDESLTAEITSFSPGEYFMVATVPESENYLQLSSVPISVQCIAVVPLELHAEINGGLVAFSLLGESLSVRMIYNDGSEEYIPSNLLSIKYQNGNALLCKDTLCEISYGDFTLEIPVSVSPATYDMSSVYWNNIDVEYDGSAHMPSIQGLPSGVNVIGYIGEEAISAGEYEFSALLSYDEENYFPPEVPTCTLVIKKALVQSVSDITLEYTGESVIIPPHDLYEVVYDNEIKSAGEYSVRYILVDSDNYIFDSGDSRCVAKVTILPRQIKVNVSDITIYLLDDAPSPSSTIYGEVASSDSLNIYYYVDGDKIYAKTDNPNYTLIVEAGMIERLPYPSKETRDKIITSAIFTILLLFIVILAIRKRGDIIDAICMFRARTKHKSGLGYINNAPSTAEPVINSPTPPITINLSTTIQNGSTPAVAIDPQVGSIVLPRVISQIPERIDNQEELHTENQITSSGDNCEKDNSLEVSRDMDKCETENISIRQGNDIIDYVDSQINYLGEDDVEELPNNENINIKYSEYCFDEDENDIDDLPDGTNVELLEGEQPESIENEEIGETVEKNEIINNDFDDAPVCNEMREELNEPRVEIKMSYANAAITDALARKLIKDEREVIYTDGKTKSVINVDTLSRNFIADDRVDVNILKKKSLIPYDTNYIKVLARGAIDKPLKVFANEFSLSAVKMILLSGGEAIRVISEKTNKTTQKK